MARATVVVLALAIGCLLVASAPARLTVDLPRQLPDAAVDREAAAEKLPCMPVADAEAADKDTAIAVPEEEGTDIAVQEERPPQHRSSLLCLVFRCGGDSAEPAGAGGVAVVHGSSQQRQGLDGWNQPEEEEVHGGEKHGAYESDSDWDSDCDSDDEDEGGILGWFWRLAEGF